MAKKLIIIFSFLLSPFVYIWGMDFYNQYSLNSSVSAYQAKTGQVNLGNVCQKIKNSQAEKLCFSIIENKKNNKEDIILFMKEKPGIDLKRICGLFEFGSASYCFSKQEMEKMIAENKNNLPSQPYYQTMVKNPYFCNKIPLDIFEFDNLDLQRRNCYLDAAIIWKDDSLCQKLKKKERDFCYLIFVAENYE